MGDLKLLSSTVYTYRYIVRDHIRIYQHDVHVQLVSNWFQLGYSNVMFSDIKSNLNWVKQIIYQLICNHH